jgi:ATP-dependent DNA helicase RecQ
VPAAGSAAARDRLLRPGVEAEPRRMWPTGLSEAKGKIPDTLLAEPGRALGRLTDIGWGTTLRALLEGPDEDVPPALVDAMVKVLAAWDWAQRPAAVVTVPSLTRPALVGSLGERIAAVGRLPYLGSVRYRGDGPGPRRHNSAHRLRSLWHAFEVPAEMGHVAGPVLLVDDRIETGWTMTVAAKLLREAGAPAVLPLALAVTS